MKKISAAVLTLGLVSFATSAFAYPCSQKIVAETPPVVTTQTVDES
ncbi:hypothetical protein [Aureimonas sp. SA4125]|nr:hypothetical protein [Aureimonas sp. SA4125]